MKTEEKGKKAKEKISIQVTLSGITTYRHRSPSSAQLSTCRVRLDERHLACRSSAEWCSNNAYKCSAVMLIHEATEVIKMR